MKKVDEIIYEQVVKHFPKTLGEVLVDKFKRMSKAEQEKWLNK